MQLEIDILKETINVLKKAPDIDQSAFSNREKAVIIDVLKNRYSLPLLLQKLQLSKSSYYYQEQSLQKEDKYTLLRVRVIELFTENKGRYGFIRSMSKKGCLPDNSACEGVFGRIKNEMFYNADWSGVNISEFISILNDYLYWYNEKKIKKSLGYLSPIEYRHRLGLVT